MRKWQPTIEPSKRARTSRKTITKYPRTKKSYTRLSIPRRVYVPGGTFPYQLQNKNVYTDTFSRSFDTGSFTSFIFSANGMYDPNITGTGTQPLYFDQLCSVYNHYTVIASSITCIISGHQNGAGAGTYTHTRCGLYIDDDTSIVTSIDDLNQRPGAQVKCMNFASNSPIVLTAGWNARRVFPGDPLGNSVLQGSAAANPTEQSFYVFGFDDPSGISNNIYATVKITYTAVWDELKTVGGS